MSRSGYNEDGDGDNWAFICYRGAVTSAIKGKRGQAMLREIIDRLDGMSVKELISSELEQEGSFCTLGVVGQARGMDMTKLDAYDPDAVAATFGIAPALAREIVYENDEVIDDHKWEMVEVFGPLRQWEARSQLVRMTYPDGGARRWEHMRKWAADNLINAEANHG